MKGKQIWAILALTLMFSLSFAFSLEIDNVDQDSLYPGKEASVDISVYNNFDKTVDDVYLTLLFEETNGKVYFTPVGSSQDYAEEIEDDDNENFYFKIKASSSVEPGDYLIPYKLVYKGENMTTETGTISVKVNSKVALDYSITQETKIIGEKDKITLKIINKGFGEVKFVSVKINPVGFTLFSEDKVYIGAVASDDIETASFNIRINKANPVFTATITYKDFENNDKTETINLDMTAYTPEKAIELGLKQKSNTPLIITGVIVLILIWILYRVIKRRRKSKRKLFEAEAI